MSLNEKQQQEEDDRKDDEEFRLTEFTRDSLHTNTSHTHTSRLLTAVFMVKHSQTFPEEPEDQPKHTFDHLITSTITTITSLLQQHITHVQTPRREISIRMLF
jgi:uncharacterized protein with von Willebrand factor type A (vWA) domain